MNFFVDLSCTEKTHKHKKYQGELLKTYFWQSRLTRYNFNIFSE